MSINTSLLPEPSVLAMPNFETVLAENEAYIKQVIPDYKPLESDPYQLILQAVAYRELHLRQAFNNKLKRSMLLYATGTDLDAEAVRYGVKRLDGELDEPFRARILESLDGHSTAGSIESYEFHAKSVSSLIDDAHAYSPSEGLVHVALASFTPDAKEDDGTVTPILTDELVANVAHALNQDKVRPLTDTVEVFVANNLHHTINAKIEIFSLSDVSTITQTIKDNFQFQLKIGVDLTHSQMIRHLHVAGVFRVTVNSHDSDITCLDHQIIRIDDVVLEFVEVDHV